MAEIITANHGQLTNHRPLITLAMLLFVVLLFTPFVSQAQPQPEKRFEGIQVPNPGAELWSAVRQRGLAVEGRSQVQGPDSGVLINPYGQQWREFRMEQLVPYSAYILAAAIILIFLFYLIRGRIPVEGGASDKKLFRYSLYERTLHWSIAAIFIFLAISGVVMLFGRTVLIPLMGTEAFSYIAVVCKEGHNLAGPLFAILLILMFFQFARRNIYQKGDLTWLLRGGGVIGKAHVPSNFFNMGEKSMFWMLVIIGGLIAASGLLMAYPLIEAERTWLELSHVSHGISTVIMMVVIIGHIYIGSIGMEGAIDGMKTGYCDLNWAKEHHDLWANKCEEQGEVVSENEGNPNSSDAQPSVGQTLDKGLS